MITHENLVRAVYRINDAWSCPGMDGKCSTDYDCTECAERLVKEYEDAIIRADERKKALEDRQILEGELHEILQDLVYAQSMINRTVSRLNGLLFSGKKEGEQT